MSEIVIAEALKRDVVDRTPAEVISLNPGYTFVGGASAVPKYLYQSLSTLWFGSSGMASAFPNIVVYGLGTGENSPKGAIETYTQRYLDQSIDYTSFRTDMAGAEVSRIYVNIIRPKNTATLATYTNIQDITFRIRYILDNATRTVRTRTGSPVAGNIPPDIVRTDPSINADIPYLCFFQDLSIATMASRAELCFICDYVRLFLR